jgi:outer membrane protein assembly factor BamA
MKLARTLIFLLAAAIPASAQYTAKKIIFNHPGPYTQAQLEAVAGIHAGMQFNADDVGNAAQRLVDSGYFDLVTPTVEGMTNAASIIFVLKPSEHAQMVHVGFENFVWLTHAEIESAILAKSPLFATTSRKTVPPRTSSTRRSPKPSPQRASPLS